MSILPITNVINVTISNTPQGLTERNVNSIALFTNEVGSSMAVYEEFVSPSQVAEIYGTNSLTARMANAIFAQVPNIRTGNGRLVIIPLLSSVSAVAGAFTTANISANLASIIGVTSGDLRVVANGVNYDLTKINFSNATSFADIAEIIQSRIVDVTVTAITDGLRFTSKKVGSTSSVNLAAVPSGTGTALNGSGFLNAAGGTSASGTNSSGETILEAIARTQGAVGYVGMLTTLSIEDTALELVSDGVQAMDKLFHYAGASTQDIAGIGSTIQQSGNTKTRFKVYTKGIDDAKLFNAAYVGRAHSVNFGGSNTSQTMNLKQLTTITPDLGITQTIYTNANAAGVDLYVSYDGVPSVYSTGGNDFFDNVYSDLALKFALETAGFNFLRQTNTKVPQTEDGMNGLKGTYGQVCERFIRNGCIAAGSWTSSERFGDPVIFDTNILTKGYYIYSLPIIQQSSVEREARKAPLVQIAIKRAGAIHSSDVLVVIND